MTRVVFATTVFDQVETGPGSYAQYLWTTFRDDPEIEFHLVAPGSPERHPHFHALPAVFDGKDSRELASNGLAAESLGVARADRGGGHDYSR